MSDKVRVYEIAEEAGASSADVIAKAKDLNIDLKSPQSAVSYEDAEEITKYIMTGKSSRLPSKPVSKAKKVVEIIPETTEVVKETKVELEKEEVIEKKDVEVVKKPELKKVIISKPIPKAAPKTQEEFDKPEVNPDNASKIVPKRRGLVIVKKNKPKEEEAVVTKSFDSENQPRKQMKSLSEILGANDEDEKGSNDNYTSAEEQRKNRIKKEKKKSVVKAQDHGKKLEVDRAYTDDFVSSDDSLLGEEVVLLDMDLGDGFKIFDEPKPQNPAKQSRSSRPAAFGNAPQGLKRGKRKKRIVRTQEEVEITEITIPEDVRVDDKLETVGPFLFLNT